MQSDPILREVYRMKDLLAQEVGNDVETLFNMLQENARQHPDRIISLRPPKPHISTSGTKSK